MRQKHVEEWPHVARQITASISAMLSKKTHSKVKSVYFEAWSTAINNGEVAAMIKMIQNGLTIKTPNVKQYDQLQVKKEVMDFTRAETETCNDCIQRFTELTERAKAMDASLGSRESLLVFLFANKKYYANKPVLQIEVYLDEMITTAENHEVKRPKFDKVAKGLRDVETRVAQYKTFSDPGNVPTETMTEEEEKIAMATTAKRQVPDNLKRRADKDFETTRKKRAHDNKGDNVIKENLATMKHCLELVATKKFASYKDALKSVKCEKCGSNMTLYGKDATKKENYFR
jgi:hypothetical protein